MNFDNYQRKRIEQSHARYHRTENVKTKATTKTEKGRQRKNKDKSNDANQPH